MIVISGVLVVFPDAFVPLKTILGKDFISLAIFTLVSFFLQSGKIDIFNDRGYIQSFPPIFSLNRYTKPILANSFVQSNLIGPLVQ